MNIKQYAIAVITIACMAGSAPAQEIAAVLPEGNPADASFVETVIHGVGLGAFTGLTAGWARYAGEYNMQAVWESAGYGAAAGLGAGIAAAAVGRNGTGNLALTDIEAGGRVGAGFGFLGGVVSALFTGDSSRVGSSLAWGQLAGAVLGVGLAGYRTATHQYTAGGNEEPAPADFRGTVELRKDSAGREYALVKVTHKF